MQIVHSNNISIVKKYQDATCLLVFIVAKSNFDIIIIMNHEF